MKKLQIVPILFCLMLSACGADEPVVTPPVVSDVSATTAVPEVIPSPTTVELPPTHTAVAEPEQPTAVPTDTPVPVPPTATAVAAAPVNSIQLLPFITEGVEMPVYLTHAGDERLFVVQQKGQIRIIENGELVAEPFLNIEDRVGTAGNEQGFLSIAFHPNYQENGYFYAYYINTDENTAVSRFQVSADNPNQADPDSEKIVLNVNQPFANHNGGLVKFGPDGYLYIGLGDGGSQGDPQNHGQNPETLLGSILRIDVNVPEDGEAAYGVPATNPFINDETKRNEIWAYGFRNPWRFSFDRLTDDLFIADVGQNQWEEVHFQPAASPGGENYGWNILEGSRCYQAETCDMTGLELPIFEYEHSVGGCSITGGYVYRGQAFPELNGNYFVSDFCTGIIWRLFPNGDGSWDSALLLDSDLDVSSFGEDINGELYVVSRDNGIYRIQP